MIIIRLGALRVAPRSRFRLVAALGVSLVTAFAEVGRLDGVKFCRWESHPEVVHVRCSEVDAEPSLDAVDRIAEVLQDNGVTAVLRRAGGCGIAGGGGFLQRSAPACGPRHDGRACGCAGGVRGLRGGG